MMQKFQDAYEAKIKFIVRTFPKVAQTYVAKIQAELLRDEIPYASMFGWRGVRNWSQQELEDYIVDMARDCDELYSTYKELDKLVRDQNITR